MRVAAAATRPAPPARAALPPRRPAAPHAPRRGPRHATPPAALPEAAAAAAAASLPSLAATLADAAASPASPLPASLLKIPGIVGDSPFVEGAVSGFLLILFSELGDKTFFIALLLALKRDKAAVFAGTFGALAVMTVISVGLGRTLHSLDGLVPGLAGFPLDDALACVLLVVFGLRTLASAADAEATAAEEKDEAEETVDAMGGDGGATAALIASTFALVFAAEWGDKSFLATIALAAASDPAGVVLGAVAGHGFATALAVAGGATLSKSVSERTVAYVGGSLFLLFAAATAWDLAQGV